jgi:hypothetical protein
VLAVALNVPLPLLLLPVHEETFADVSLTPGGRTAAVYPWLVWEWMLGNQPLPGRLSRFEDEWHSGAVALALYERVKEAQTELQREERRIDELRYSAASTAREQARVAKALERGERDRTFEDPAYVKALQALVDTTAAMEDAGLPADGLIGGGQREGSVDRWVEAIADHRIERTPPPRRRRLIDRAEVQP